MYLKDVTPGHTYRMESARGVWTTFTVETVRYAKGYGCTIETAPDAVIRSGSVFSRPGLTMVEEVK